MRSVKSGLIEFCALCVLTLVFGLVPGSPFLAGRPALAQAQERPPQQSEQNQDQNRNQAATFAGTVVKDGQHYDLRDSSGEVFKLDDAERAKPFAGRTVKVTGELDAQAKVIHVESIEGAEG
jgi:Protein of unknown function (DUF5818)